MVSFYIRGRCEPDPSAVKVVVRVRPLMGPELESHSTAIVDYPFKQQLAIGQKRRPFTFDQVLTELSTQSEVYDLCCRNLVDSFLDGYNATVFAYGQTGSGKTHTMGTANSGSLSMSEEGIIPRVIRHIFSVIEQRHNIEYTIQVAFVEIHNEELNDLLCTGSKTELSIREGANGEIYINNATRMTALNSTNMFSILEKGSSQRSVGSTNMNSQSSRSHSIFTVYLTQKKVSEDLAGVKSVELEVGESITSKFHFVDLAGSERLKRTGASGQRMKEGISINCGLLALGSVIAALADPARSKGHIPFRNSKITRLLQDSLGGNSRTLMIACISPADVNEEESTNTLMYASRAKNIRNKPVLNRDPQSVLISELRARVAQLEKMTCSCAGGSTSLGDIYGVQSQNVELVNYSNQLQASVAELETNLSVQQQRVTELQMITDKTYQRTQSSVAMLQDVKSLVASAMSIEGESVVFSKNDANTLKKNIDTVLSNFANITSMMSIEHNRPLPEITRTSLPSQPRTSIDSVRLSMGMISQPAPIVKVIRKDSSRKRISKARAAVEQALEAFQRQFGITLDADAIQRGDVDLAVAAATAAAMANGSFADPSEVEDLGIEIEHDDSTPSMTDNDQENVGSMVDNIKYQSPAKRSISSDEPLPVIHNTPKRASVLLLKNAMSLLNDSAIQSDDEEDSIIDEQIIVNDGSRHSMPIVATAKKTKKGLGGNRFSICISAKDQELILDSYEAQELSKAISNLSKERESLDKNLEQKEGRLQQLTREHEESMIDHQVYSQRCIELEREVLQVTRERDQVLEKFKKAQDTAAQKAAESRYAKQLKDLKDQLTDTKSKLRQADKARAAHDADMRVIQDLQDQIASMRRARVLVAQQMEEKMIKVKEVSADKDRQVKQLQKQHRHDNMEVTGLKRDLTQKNKTIKRQIEQITSLNRRIQHRDDKRYQAIGMKILANRTRTRNSMASSSMSRRGSIAEQKPWLANSTLATNTVETDESLNRRVDLNNSPGLAQRVGSLTITVNNADHIKSEMIESQELMTSPSKRRKSRLSADSNVVAQLGFEDECSAPSEFEVLSSHNTPTNTEQQQQVDITSPFSHAFKTSRMSLAHNAMPITLVNHAHSETPSLYAHLDESQLQLNNNLAKQMNIATEDKAESMDAQFKDLQDMYNTLSTRSMTSPNNRRAFNSVSTQQTNNNVAPLTQKQQQQSQSVNTLVSEDAENVL